VERSNCFTIIILYNAYPFIVVSVCKLQYAPFHTKYCHHSIAVKVIMTLDCIHGFPVIIHVLNLGTLSTHFIKSEISSGSTQQSMHILFHTKGALLFP
jgi:hypothetical protein